MAAPRRHPWLSSSRRQLIVALVVVVFPIVVLAALFLMPYLRGESAVPFGFDTPHYIWRANVTIAEGFDALNSFRPELNANAERPAFPVLAALFDASGGPQPSLLVFVMPAVCAIAVGLAAGSFAVEILEEPPWAFSVFAVLVGGSLAVVRTAVGSLDALVVEPVVLAAGAATIIAAAARRGMVGAIVLLTAAVIIHWVLAVFFLVLLTCLAIVLVPSSLHRVRDGASIRGTPSARIGAVAGASAGAGLLTLLRVTSWPQLQLPNVSEAKIASKVAARVPALRLWISGPVAVLGACTLWFPKSPLRRWGSILLIGWGGTVALAVVAYETLDARWLPAYRVAEFTLAIPLLAAAAVVSIARWTFSRGLAAIAGSLIVVAVIAVSFRVSVDAWRSSPSLMDPDVTTEVTAATDYLRSVRSTGPVIFIVSTRAFTASDRAIRASLPGDLISSVSTFLGDGEDLLAGHPTTDFAASESARSWEAIGPLIGDDLTAIWIGSLNPKFPAPDGSRLIAPGVSVVRGPAPAGLTQLRPVPAPSAGELIGAGMLTLAVLMIVGSGWAVALVDASWLSRVGLVPAFGVAVLILSGVAAGTVGWPLTGGPGLALVAAATAGGWGLVAVPWFHDAVVRH